MRTFWIRAVLFVLGLVALDALIGAAVPRLLARSQADRRFGALVHDRIRAQTLVIGSSRAARDVLASALPPTAFNLGYPGSNVEFHQLLVAFLLEHDPELQRVVWVLDDDQELKRSELGFRSDTLYGDVDDAEVRAVLIARGELDPWYSVASRAYCQRLGFQQLFKDWAQAGLGSELNRVLADGSMPLAGKSASFAEILGSESDGTSYRREDEDPKLVAAFAETVRALAGRQIIFVFPPNLGAPKPGFEARIRELGGPDSRYLSYADGTWGRSLFYDRAHLDQEGAVRFSARLAQDLATVSSVPVREHVR